MKPRQPSNEKVPISAVEAAKMPLPYWEMRDDPFMTSPLMWRGVFVKEQREESREQKIVKFGKVPARERRHSVWKSVRRCT